MSRRKVGFTEDEREREMEGRMQDLLDQDLMARNAGVELERLSNLLHRAADSIFEAIDLRQQVRELEKWQSDKIASDMAHHAAMDQQKLTDILAGVYDGIGAARRATNKKPRRKSKRARKT